MCEHLSPVSMPSSVGQHIAFIALTCFSYGLETLTHRKDFFMGFLAVATHMNCGGRNIITAESFAKILNTENVPNVLFDMCDKNNSSQVTVDDVMHFFTLLTAPM